MSNTTPPDYIQDSDDTTIGSFGYGLGLSVAVLFFFVVITFISYKCKQSRTHSAAAAGHRSSADYGEGSTIHVIIRHPGLDAATIAAFPQYTYGQLKPHKGGGACAVCLGDYKDAETLRLLPECGHVFHRSCIDPWLMIHPTCPICRNSPLPTPVETPPPSQPAPVANQYTNIS